MIKKEILANICFTELVYYRINKKLNIKFTKRNIEKIISEIITETDDLYFHKVGKNIYITNNERNVRLTINCNTHRIITADKLNNSLPARF